MSESTSQPENAPDLNQDDVLEWRCHPVRRRPLVSVAVTAFILLVAVVVYYSTERSQAFAVLSLLVLFLSLARFYLPTAYRLTADGITIKTVTQTLFKEWSLYRSCYPDKNGILLSPFVRRSRLESFRGIYLMYADNREQVVTYVRSHLGAAAEEAAQPGKDGPS